MNARNHQHYTEQGLFLYVIVAIYNTDERKLFIDFKDADKSLD